MKIASVEEVNAHFETYLKQCAQSPVVIFENNHPVAVLVPVGEDEEELERLILAHTPQFCRLLKAGRERIRQTGGMEHEEFWNLVEAQ